MKNRHVFLFLLHFLLLSSCGDQTGKKPREKGAEKIAGLAETTSIQETKEPVTCDTALWRYVYNPERLQVLDYCKTVTGVIEESNADDDGDQHMLLKLEKGQEDLLTRKNIRKKQGDLVIEAVCANKVLRKKVGTTCNGYINQIQLPNVGDRVKVSGSLVNDTHNGWNEIHPITRIERLQ